MKLMIKGIDKELEKEIRAEDFPPRSTWNIIFLECGSEAAGPVLATLVKLRGGERIDLPQIPYITRGALKRRAKNERDRLKKTF